MVASREPDASTRKAVLIGTASLSGDGLYDLAGKLLGEIDELVLDVRVGRIAYALVAVGGIFGIGRQLIAVPWGAITVDLAFQRCVINFDQQRLIGAPILDRKVFPQIADPRWGAEVHNYFGCKPYWE